MRFTYHLVRRYPATTVFVAAIWYLSFFTPPHTELDSVAFIDKWVHLAMYGGTCAVFWAEHLYRHRHPAVTVRLLLAAWAAPILMSGAIELLQEYCTGGRRSGDWTDLAANATGVTLAAVIGLLALRWRSRRNRGTL